MNVLSRLLRIESATGFGTAFTIEHGDEQFLITARHVVPENDPVNVQLLGANESFTESLTRVAGIPAAVDIAAFPLPHVLTPALPVAVMSTGMTLGQDVFFLGYAYGVAFAMPGLGMMPLVKKATLSGIQHEDGTTIIYLDGFNNPGFSGGPVVFYSKDSDEQRIGAVISGYRIDPLEVISEGQSGQPATVQANSGIIISHNIGFATEAIVAFREEYPRSAR